MWVNIGSICVCVCMCIGNICIIHMQKCTILGLPIKMFICRNTHIHPQNLKKITPFPDFLSYMHAHICKYTQTHIQNSYYFHDPIKHLFLSRILIFLIILWSIFVYFSHKHTHSHSYFFHNSMKYFFLNHFLSHSFFIIEVKMGEIVRKWFFFQDFLSLTSFIIIQSIFSL